MENLDSSISNIDASSKVLLKTVVHKLLPSLAVPPDKSLDWEDVLNNYTIAAKQLDNLWMDMKPEFSMSIVTPKNVFKSEFTIPQLLTTMNAQDESHCVIQPDEKFTLADKDDQTELQKLIRTHNNTISGVVDDLSASIDEFKSEITREKNKKRKLNS